MPTFLKCFCQMEFYFSVYLGKIFFVEKTLIFVDLFFHLDKNGCKIKERKIGSATFCCVILNHIKLPFFSSQFEGQKREVCHVLDFVSKLAHQLNLLPKLTYLCLQSRPAINGYYEYFLSHLVKNCPMTDIKKSDMSELPKWTDLLKE